MRKMKSIDLFCASQASTAICSGINQRAITHPINRQSHRLAHEIPPENRKNATYFPLDPSNQPSHHKPRKNISNKSAKQVELSRRKSSADVDDLASLRASTRPLLSDDRSFLYVIPGSERALTGKNKCSYYKRLSVDGLLGLRSISTGSCDNDEYRGIKASPASGVHGDRAPISLSPSKKMSQHVKEDLRESLSARSNPQVVELRVSIHCKGCEGKLRKYISRMEGVTSFSIDLATKKVRVTGDVSPLDVLTSISKVKNAQLWSSSISSSSPKHGSI